jgi:hypothetical protein
MIKAPTFFLTAVGAARIIGGPPAPAVPLLLIFHGHLGADIASRINRQFAAKVLASIIS